MPYKQLLDLLASRHRWVEREFAILLAIVGGGLALFFLKSFSFGVQFGGMALGIAALSGTWCVAREVYWRRHSAGKIGLVIQGDGVKDDQIEKTTVVFKEISEKINDGKILRIRLVTRRILLTEERRKCFANKYAFDIIVVIALQSEGNVSPRFTLFQADAKKLGDSVGSLIDEENEALWHSVASPPSKREMDSVTCEVLFECVLLYLCALYLSNREWDKVRQVADYLEVSIERRFGVEQKPRKFVRWMLKASMLNECSYPVEGPSTPDILERTIASCDEARTRFSTQFPEIHLAQSRNLFFAGRYSDALGFLTEIRSVIEVRPAEMQANFWINMAVIQLFLSNWKRSDDAFREWARSTGFRHYNPKVLLPFALSAVQYDQQCGEFLVVLYKTMANETIDVDVRNRVLSWLNEDESRRGLQAFLLRESPLFIDGMLRPRPRAGVAKRNR
jgi:hypothetical protein